ncbi:30S ribosomal protein S6 [Candidatus Kaiserbacteria bacterium]|nr:30S ribosomal protein S6 [Candidatus Kaiserbacteria bacterium]
MTEVENTEDITYEAENVTEDVDLDPRVYELGFHIVPAISEEEAPKEALAIKEFIKENGGVVISEEDPKHVELAYAMYRTESGKKEKFETAHFGGIKFEIDPIGIAKLKEVLDINRNILRHIIFRTVKENTHAEVRLPQVRVERKHISTPKMTPKNEEVSVPVSEKALDESIKEIVVE